MNRSAVALALGIAWADIPIVVRGTVMSMKRPADRSIAYSLGCLSERDFAHVVPQTDNLWGARFEQGFGRRSIGAMTTGFAPLHRPVSTDFVRAGVFFNSASIVPILVSVRLHATRHSAFVIWVSRSQKFIQSARVFPPPPGALADASLALELPVGARLVRPGAVAEDERLVGVPPLDKGVVLIRGDIEGSGAREGQ